MNTNEIITPDIVRWVLGIEFDELDIEEVEKGRAEYLHFGILDQHQVLEWYHIKPLNIHEFIYLAIEKCLLLGFRTQLDHWLNFSGEPCILGVFSVRAFCYSHTGNATFAFGKGRDYPSRLHAQLAAIAWVYGKRQEGK